MSVNSHICPYCFLQIVKHFCLVKYHKNVLNIAGYKLAGANNPVVRRTSSHSSTASNKSSPSSAASSPKTSRSTLSTVTPTTTAAAASTSVGNVDR